MRYLLFEMRRLVLVMKQSTITVYVIDLFFAMSMMEEMLRKLKANLRPPLRIVLLA